MDFDNRKVYGDTSITDGLVLHDTDDDDVDNHDQKLIFTDYHLSRR